jgi:hypothetical protein
MSEKITLKIAFMDGKTERVAFTPAEGAQMQRGTTMERLMAANSLALVVDETVVLYPMNNIRSIEMTPAPEILPNFIVRTRKLDPV